ncbi:MAG: hypothetical protein ACTSQF_09420, partial [Candidatus Heimdallarchaeaceae archaeon]
TEFLRTFSASTDKIKEDFITIEQVFSDVEIAALNKDLKIKKLTLFNELLLEMYVNYKKLSPEILKLLQVLKHPLSASAKFNTSDIQSLNSKSIYTYIDLLIKPTSYWPTFAPIKLKTKIQELLPTLTLKKIKSDTTKRIKISTIKIFNPKIRKELNLVYQTIDELIFDITTENYRISKSIINSVQKILATSVLLVNVPKIPLKAWKKTITSLKEIGDLFKLSNKDLGTILSIPPNDAKKTIASLTQDNILYPPVVKASKILSSKDVEMLHSFKLRNFIQLLDAMKVSKTIPKDLKEKINTLIKLDVKKLEPKINESMTLMELLFLTPNLQTLTLTKSQKDLLQRTSDFMFSKGTELCTVLNIDESKRKIKCPDLSLEYLLLLHKFDSKLYTSILGNLPEEYDSQIKELFRYLERSPVILSKPTLENIDQIASQEFVSISEMLLEPKKSLFSVVTDHTLQRNIRNISLNLLKELKDNFLKFPEKLYATSELNTLKRFSIYSVEEALLFYKKTKSKNTKEWELCSKLNNIMAMELNDLPAMIENKEAFNYAIKNKLKTIYDLLAHCKHNTSSAVICKEVLPLIRFDLLADLLTKEQRRLSNFVKGTELNALLKKYGLKTFGSLYNFIEKTELQSMESDFEKLLSILRAPVSIFTGDQTLSGKLNKTGFNQVIDLLLPANINSVLSKSKLTDKQLTAAKEMTKKLSFIAINDIITADCYPINSVSFIDDNIKKQLLKSGYSTITHLNISDEILMRTSGLKALPLSRIKKILTTPFYYLSELTRENPSSLFNLYNKGISIVKDIFVSNCKQLSKQIEVPERQMKSLLSTLTDQSIKLAQKDETDLKPSMPYIGDQEIQKLAEADITSVQEIIFPTKEAKKSSALTLVKVAKFVQHLDKKIEELDVKAGVLVQIKQLGINNFKEFILYPSAVLDSKVDLSYMAIKGLKNRLPLTSSKKPAAKKSTTSKTTTKPKTKATTTTKKTTSSASKSKKSSSTKPPAKKPPSKTTSSKSSKQTTLLDMGSSQNKKTLSSSSKSSSKSKKRSSGK